MNPPLCESCKAPQPPRQRFAFTAVIDEQGWVIGLAEEGTRGYTKLLQEGIQPDEATARARAAALNKHVGWTDEGAAQMVVLTTMPMKEDHLAGLLGQAVAMLRRVVDEDKFVETEEITEFIDVDCKGYAKEPA
jgi:threonine synthase